MDINDQINKELQKQDEQNISFKTIDDNIEDIFDVFSNGVNATCYKEGRTALTGVSGNITFYDIKNDFKSLHNLFTSPGIRKLVKRNKHHITKQRHFGKLASKIQSSRKRILILESIFITVFLTSIVTAFFFPGALVFIAFFFSFGAATTTPYAIIEKEAKLFSIFLKDKDKLDRITNKDFLSKEVNSKANYSEDDDSLGKDSDQEISPMTKISDIFKKQEYEYVDNSKNRQSSSSV